MRFDIPLADWYMAPGHRVTIGAHCIDTAWPWWYPALPDEPMGTPPQALLPLEDPDEILELRRTGRAGASRDRDAE